MNTWQKSSSSENIETALTIAESSTKSPWSGPTKIGDAIFIESVTKMLISLGLLQFHENQTCPSSLVEIKQNNPWTKAELDIHMSWTGKLVKLKPASKVDITQQQYSTSSTTKSVNIDNGDKHAQAIYFAPSTAIEMHIAERSLAENHHCTERFLNRLQTGEHSAIATKHEMTIAISLKLIFTEVMKCPREVEEKIKTTVTRPIISNNADEDPNTNETEVTFKICVGEVALC